MKRKNSHKMKKIIIDGNIGSGKTSMMEYLSKKFKISESIPELDSIGISLDYITEPVNTWKPYLDNFYNDMKQNAMPLQMKILHHHLSVDSKKNNNRMTMISERSSTSTIDVFGKNLLNNSLLSNLEFDIMNDYNKSFNTEPDVYIYIKASPETCLERIKKRNRDCETGIGLEYLSEIDDLYNQMYESPQVKMKSYIIDGEKDFKDVYNQIVVKMKQCLRDFYE